MKQITRTSLLSGAGLLALALSAPSQAALSWTFNSSSSCQAASVGNTCTQSSITGTTTITATATAWSTSTTSIGSTLEQATLRRWDGLAVNSVGESNTVPQHATDNNGKFESILYSFDKSIALTNVTMGWHYDADFSLLRYAGVGTPTLAGNTYSDLTSGGGWELVDNYYYSGCESSCSGTDKNVNSNYDNGPLNPGNATSSYWLIAALNSAYNTRSSGYVGNDYFKVKNLAGIYTAPPGNSVPEPASMALMSIGFAAFGFTRRRKKA